MDETGPNAEDGAVGGAIGSGPDLDELCRLAAKEMIAVALESERRAWLDSHAHLTDATGRRLVEGNSYLPERTIKTGAGQVDAVPRVADKRRKDERELFSSAILTPLHAHLSEGHRGVAGTVTAEAVDRGLRPSAGGVLRVGCGPFGIDDQPAH